MRMRRGVVYALLLLIAPSLAPRTPMVVHVHAGGDHSHIHLSEYGRIAHHSHAGADLAEGYNNGHLTALASPLFPRKSRSASGDQVVVALRAGGDAPHSHSQNPFLLAITARPPVANSTTLEVTLPLAPPVKQLPGLRFPSLARGPPSTRSA